jgi:hypothetical protein|nr:MAG TPA: cysteine peptidase [Caudoviricetes sp.]
MKVYLAFYKHKRKCNSLKNIVFRIFDEIIRFVTKGEFSHCEIAIPYDRNSDGQILYECYTSSNMDGGVRCKLMPLPQERWTLVPVKFNEEFVRTFFQLTIGAKYDFWGALGVVLPIKESSRKFFCSEWCAACLEMPQPSRYSPNSLYRKLTNR